MHVLEKIISGDIEGLIEECENLKDFSKQGALDIDQIKKFIKSLKSPKEAGSYLLELKRKLLEDEQKSTEFLDLLEGYIKFNASKNHTEESLTAFK